MKKLLTIICLCALASACNDSTTGQGLHSAPHGAVFAVLSTNYVGATNVSLLGKDGEVLDPGWVSSKTKDGNLHTPLAEDVVLPSTSFSANYLTTIERQLGVITRFDLESGDILGAQLRTDDSPATDKAAYHSNPQDVYYVNEHSAWVSRWAPNLDSSAAVRERGTDLIEFDPGAMKRTDRRIDLSSLSTMIEEEQYDAKGKDLGKVKSMAYARPTGLVPAGAFLVVGLVRATESFNYAPGMVAVIDPVAGKLKESVALTGLRNCGELRPVLGEATQVLVACIGAWGDAGAAAGIVKLAVDDQGKTTVVETFAVGNHTGATDTNSNMVSLGGDLVVAIAPGELDPTSMKVTKADAAFSVDLKTGKQKMIYESKGAFALGLPSYDADTGVLLIPDAGDMGKPIFGAQRLLVDPDTHEIKSDSFVSIAASTTLAAREIHKL
jgi:hypothetical protein